MVSMAQSYPPGHPPASKGRRRFALFVAICTLGLIFAGGLVTSKDAGLSVPDWPLSYGSLNPEGWFQIENVRAEHGHRLIAGSVAILTLILTIWTWRTDPRRSVRLLGLFMMAAIMAQALLGGLTVLFLLPTPISVSHALLGQAFLCLTWAMALVTSPSWSKGAEPAPDPANPALRSLCLGFTAVIFVQLTLGALMRHTASGLAIYDFPLSYGHLIPPLDEASLAEINVERRRLELGNVAAGQILIHFAHRLWAIVVCGIGAWLVARIFGRHGKQGALVWPVLFIAALLALQVVLGILTVLSMKNPHVATAHVAVGAALLAASVVVCLQSFRLVGQFAPTLSPSAGGAETSQTSRPNEVAP